MSYPLSSGLLPPGTEFQHFSCFCKSQTITVGLRFPLALELLGKVCLQVVLLRRVSGKVRNHRMSILQIEHLKDRVGGVTVETSFGEILGGSINEGIGLAKAFTFWDDLADEATLLRNDQAAFNLFELADMDITGATVEEVEYKMSAAISYARSNAWFFTNSTHQTWQKNWTGSIQYTNYPSAFMNLVTLQHMKNEGTAESEIQEQINSYWSVFGCSQVVAINSHIGYTNTTLKNAIIIYEQARPAPYAGTVLVIEPYYHYALTHYDDELSVIGNSFSEYMELMMDAYTK